MFGGDDVTEFTGFNSRIGAFLSGELGVEDREEFKRLLCADCEFFTPGEDEELECGCYHILTRLFDRGCITLEQLADALAATPGSAAPGSDPNATDPNATNGIE